MNHPLPGARYYLPALIVFLLLTSFTVYYTPTPEPPDGPYYDRNGTPYYADPDVNCELCEGGPIVPWGPLTCVEVPMYGGACTVKVCFRKRVCNGRQQIKILSTMVPPNTPCATENDDVNFTSAGTTLLAKMLSEHEPFGLVPPGSQYDWTGIDIYRYVCKMQVLCPGQVSGEPPVETIPPKLVSIPCTKQACCKMSFTVRRLSGDCGVEGYMGTQKNNDRYLRYKKGACDTSYNGYAKSDGETYTGRDTTRGEVGLLLSKLSLEGHVSCASAISNALAKDPANDDLSFKPKLQCNWDCKAMNMSSGAGPGGGGSGTWKIVDGKFKYD